MTKQELVLDIVEKKVRSIIRLTNSQLVSQRGNAMLKSLKEDIIKILEATEEKPTASKPSKLAPLNDK
jgi:hypothetical protein